MLLNDPMVWLQVLVGGVIVLAVVLHLVLALAPEWTRRYGTVPLREGVPQRMVRLLASRGVRGEIRLPRREFSEAELKCANAQCEHCVNKARCESVIEHRQQAAQLDFCTNRDLVAQVAARSEHHTL